MLNPARYDGYADWYDERFAPSALAAPILERLLGPGSGCCLDLCCGTGLRLEEDGRMDDPRRIAPRARRA